MILESAAREAAARKALTERFHAQMAEFGDIAKAERLAMAERAAELERLAEVERLAAEADRLDGFLMTAAQRTARGTRAS